MGQTGVGWRQAGMSAAEGSPRLKEPPFLWPVMDGTPAHSGPPTRGPSSLAEVKSRARLSNPECVPGTVVYDLANVPAFFQGQWDVCLAGTTWDRRQQGPILLNWGPQGPSVIICGTLQSSGVMESKS
jgi:hypothetical protein